jgi:hypothetical protein
MLNECEQLGNRGRFEEALARIDEANRVIEESSSGEIETRVQLRAQAD